MLQTLRISTFLLAFIWVWGSQSKAQIIGPVPSPTESIARNSVSNMAAYGDTLWIGPSLNRTVNNSAQWYYPKNATEIISGNGRVFSLALAPDTVIAGLGYNADTPDGSVQAGLGFYISTDGGNNWEYIENPNESVDDTSLVYGGTTYKKLPITAQEQSPPFEIAQLGNTIFSANWALGLIRSQEFGNRWERIILPPQQANSLIPERVYEFNSEEGNRYNPRYDQNLLDFSVHLPFDLFSPSVDYAFLQEPNNISSMHTFGIQLKL